MKYFKTGEKKRKNKIKNLMALLIAGTMLTCSVSYAAGKFIDISKNLQYHIKKDNIGVDGYTNQQGFCIDDDGNYYVARINNDTQKARIYKLTKTQLKNNKKGESLLDGEFTNRGVTFNLGHANDMTYCKRDGYIYIYVLRVEKMIVM